MEALTTWTSSLCRSTSHCVMANGQRPSSLPSAMHQTISESAVTMTCFRFSEKAWHSYLSTYGHAMCQARSNCLKARSHLCRSVGGRLASTSPTRSLAASVRVMRPLKWLMTSECHSNTPTSMPSARSTGKSGCCSTVHSTGSASCAFRWMPTCLCSASSVTAERKAQIWGISISRFCCGKSRTSAASLSSATNFPSSAAPPQRM
mmetsp:Transcript_80935/g.223837  ORF Transcript_80935/g.223837 Transcript_80935/m.223837 type:complete len:205 (+) Transcript_80935:1030-1644(+)